MSDFEKVRDFLLDLDLSIKFEDPADQLFIVEKQSEGINNMIIDCQAPILLMEQVLFDLPSQDSNTLKELLKMNRSIVFGSLTLDQEGQRVIFRNTLLLETLDKDELASTLNSLSIFLAETHTQLLQFAQV